jgi:hypothetical protein
MDELTKEIMSSFQAWVKGLLGEAEKVGNRAGAEALETRVRTEGLRLLGRVWERLLQHVVDRQEEARVCPHCGRRRRHKGVRSRGLVSSVGPVRLQGPYWYCPACHTGAHALDALAPESASGVARELICLLGTSLASFAKASRVCQKALGIQLDEETIRTWCLAEGQRALETPPVPPAVPEQADLVGSCDGTMIHTRQDGWRELKAYRFEHAAGRHAGAYLENAEVFLPRVRQAAIAMKASRARRIIWVADAAEWIDKGITVQLPSAKRIVDLWHGRQHIHEAARLIYGEGTPEAKRWARRYGEELRQDGGRVVWHSLRRVRYQDPTRQKALAALLGFLDRHADRMDYPTYERFGYPISSGPMESFCKQLGQRLKGPGMRWSIPNVNPMAALVCLWTQDEWDAYWRKAG